MGKKSQGIKKLRRRIEDCLRNSSPIVIIKVADFLGVRVPDYIRKFYSSGLCDSAHNEPDEPAD